MNTDEKPKAEDVGLPKCKICILNFKPQLQVL
jgi:hypothetical protein